MERADYTIGIICALSVELAAVRATLDELHPDLPKVANDNNTYILGRISNHNVVVACLPAGAIGTVSAANVANQLRHSFASVRIGLMVGIAGGVPSPRDIRLGDVVVSKPSGTFNGVVQYDFGKTGRGANFTISGQLDRPPTVLLGAVSKLDAKHMTEGRELENTLTDLFQKFPDFAQSCSSPGPEQDQLYQADYDHPRGETDCTSCDSAQLVARKPRVRQGPKIHYGLIASGNQVIKHGRTRDNISKNYGSLCFEMEAAGLVNNFPCLVIRGICDYADSHKNKDWQPHAALVAAAYAKELLSVTPAEEIVRTRPANQNEEDSSLVPREAWYIQRSATSNWLELLSRISDYDREKVHRRLSKKRLNGTGRWFLSHPSVQTWVDSTTTSSLWCSGDVGAGKTMLCSALIDELKLRSTKSNPTMAFFYIETAERKSLRADYLFCSLLKQTLENLLYARQKCPPEVSRLVELYFNPAGPVPDLEDLTHLFSLVFTCASNTAYVIDGLDEMPKGEIMDVLSTLHRVLDDATLQKVFISSRSELGLNIRDRSKNERKRVLSNNNELMEQLKEGLAKGAQGMFLWVRLQIEALWLECFCDEDIEKSLHNLPPDLPSTYSRCLARISTETTERARRVLRWVVCSRRPLRIDELQEAVSFDLNDETWNPRKVTSSDIVLGSCSNLVVLEEHDQSVRLAHPSVKTFLLGQKSSVSPLYRIDEETAEVLCGEECVNYLTFSDFSLQLTTNTARQSPAKLPNPAAVLGALPFATVLTSLSSMFPSSSAIYQTKLPALAPVSRRETSVGESKYALLKYARENWAMHTWSIASSSKVYQRFRSLALQPTSSWKLHPWISSGQSQTSQLHGMLLWSARWRHIPFLNILLSGHIIERTKSFCDLPCAEDGLPALHTAARLGFIEVTAMLLKVCNVNGWGPHSRVALHYAAEKNHLGVAQTLLSLPEALGSLVSDSHETALGLAVHSGWEEMVSLLLAAGALVSPDGVEPNPLVVAASNGYTTMVQAMLARIKQDATEEDYYAIGNALAVAAAAGDEVIFRMLFEHKGKSHMIRSESGHPDDTLIALAAKGGHQGIVRTLLNVRDELQLATIGVDEFDFTSLKHDLVNPIYLAAEFGNEAALQLLVARHQMDVKWKMVNWTRQTESHNRDYKEALLRAIRGNHVRTVRYLLDYFEGVNFMQNGRTPLLIAVECGHVAMVQLLLARYPDIDLDQDDITRLVTAIGHGDDEVLQALLKVLEKRPSWVTRGNLFIFAASHGQVELINVLLDQKWVDVNYVNTASQTPVIAAAQSSSARSAETLKTLLQHKDIMADGHGFNRRTALSFAAAGDDLEKVRMLLQRDDVDPDSRDSEDLTPLVYAAAAGKIDAVRLLLDRRTISSITGVERTAVAADFRDSRGRTPFCYASAGGHLDVMTLLLSLDGADTTTPAKQDQIALFWAVMSRQVGSVNFILDRSLLDVNAQDESGRTALSYASADGCPDVSVGEAMLDALLKRKDLQADLGDQTGRTPLSWAAGSLDSSYAVNKLLDRADVNPLGRDEQGRCALMYAAKAGNNAVVKILLERAAASTDFRDSSVKTPAAYALNLETLALFSDRDIYRAVA